MSSGSYTASMPKRYNQACPVAKSLEVVGDRWTLLVVRDLLSGPRRFQDFLGTLPGIAPNILSARLKLMEEHGLIVREFYSDRPPRAQYVLSEKGRELGMVVGALAAWGGRHVHKQTRLVHAGCGHPVSVGYYCPDCGEGVRGADVTVTRARSRRGTRAARG
jgi:DNA-binding HxlR family transcriptional regulator